MLAPVAHPAGKILFKQIKAWRTKFFIFLANRDVPATNNISEREIRPSVVFRKSLPPAKAGVINGFRSDWGAQIHAGYRSVTGTARLNGRPAFDAIATSSMATSPSPESALKANPVSIYSA